MELDPQQRAKYIKAIEKIESTPRPEKWRLIKKLVLDLKPWYKPLEHDHAQACKELRLKTEDAFAASKSGAMRNSMKIFAPVLTGMMKLDPDLTIEWSGKNQGDQEKVGKQLWDAFPEYRTSRKW